MVREVNFSPFLALLPRFAIRVELQEGRCSPVFLFRWKEVHFFFLFPGPGAAAGPGAARGCAAVALRVIRRGRLAGLGRLWSWAVGSFSRGQCLAVPCPRRGFHGHLRV